MNSAFPASTVRAIRTPRAAAVAGIVFSVLFASSVVLIQWAIPADSSNPGPWIDDPDRRKAVSLSLQLLPFAGIAFLWFIGVLRDRIGEGEDRFFATVFLGSGLLFIAMFFASGAMAAGLVTTAAEATGAGRLGNLWPFGRRSTASLASVYGLRMAAVFTIVGDHAGDAATARAPLARRARLRDCCRAAARCRPRAVARTAVPWLGVRVERLHSDHVVPSRWPAVRRDQRRTGRMHRSGRRLRCIRLAVTFVGDR